ncbi:Probable ADP-ribosylation factor GTPase-activating protein AGD14 [Linum perenne]
MASRVKEDEKNERTIRGLLKLPENRRCINCNSLGPQYVCTNFWTFVCTTCSGIHREFTHRVKSISMAKFTSQEVAALQEGGNKLHYVLLMFVFLNLAHMFFRGSNVDRLRDFIKHVYVDKRYTGDKNFGKPLNMKTNRRTDAYQGGSRSPPYEDVYDRRFNQRSSPGGRSDDRNNRYDERRSPGYDPEGRRYNDYSKSPARPEIINDWRREDRFGNGKKAEDRRVSDGDSTPGGRSPDRPNDVGAYSPPVVRPVREILGDNVGPLRISEPPKPNAVRAAADGFVATQRTASSSSLGSINENPTEVKVEPLASLIDFESDPAPPVAMATPQAQPQTATQPAAQTLATGNDNNWASFDFAPAVTASQAPASAASPFDSVLSQLSATPSVSDSTHSILNGTGTPLTPAASASALPYNSTASAPGAGQWAHMQHQQASFLPNSVAQSTNKQFPSPSNQPWNSSLPSNVQAALSTAPGAGTVPGPATTQPSTATGRHELPADLFTATYPSYGTMNQGWQTGPPHGMMYPTQYANVPVPMQYSNVAAPTPNFIQHSKSANPFDVNEPTPAPAQPFPNMSSLQSALPNMLPHSGIQRGSSVGNSAQAWMPNQPPQYPSGLHPQLQSYATTAPPRATTSQVPSLMPLPGHPGVASFSNDGGGIHLDRPLADGFSATLQSFPSMSGNPFG